MEHASLKGRPGGKQPAVMVANGPRIGAVTSGPSRCDRTGRWRGPRPAIGADTWFVRVGPRDAVFLGDFRVCLFRWHRGKAWQDETPPFTDMGLLRTQRLPARERPPAGGAFNAARTPDGRPILYRGFQQYSARACGDLSETHSGGCNGPAPCGPGADGPALIYRSLQAPPFVSPCLPDEPEDLPSRRTKERAAGSARMLHRALRHCRVAHGAAVSPPFDRREPRAICASRGPFSRPCL